MDGIILLGAPGAGKGTVAEDIKQSVHFLHLSTGDMLRDSIKAGRALGLKAKSFMDRGELVPDEVVAQLVEEKLDEGGPAARYMFDGYPRTTRQAEMLDEALAKRGGKISNVFVLDVPREILISRIAGRRICRQCGAVYNVRNMRPKVEGVCDKCGGEVYQRSDDNEVTVSNRLEVFHTKTKSLIDFYERQGKLVRVDAVDRLRTEEAIVARLSGPR